MYTSSQVKQHKIIELIFCCVTVLPDISDLMVFYVDTFQERMQCWLLRMELMRFLCPIMELGNWMVYLQQ